MTKTYLQYSRRESKKPNSTYRFHALNWSEIKAIRLQVCVVQSNQNKDFSKPKT